MNIKPRQSFAQWSGVLAVVLFWTETAFAHVQKGEAAGFLSGLKHPISGLDHVLAMVAVGLWGAQLGAPAVWVLPVAFPMVMAFGGMLGLIGVPLPGIEYGIAASAILLGVAVMFEIRPPLAIAALVVATFAIFHGHAHGTELPAGPERPALQHGVCNRHRMPARCWYHDRHSASLGLGTEVPPPGRCSRPLRWSLLHVEGDHRMNRPEHSSRIPIYAAVFFASAMLPLAAHAHLNSTGMGPIYDGLMHFLMSPEDVVPVLALALLAGLRGATYGRRTLFVLPAAWLVGGFAGLAASSSNGNAIVSAVWFLVMGGLLALDAKLSLRVTTALAALLGLYHGYLNGAGLGLSLASAAVLLGLIFAVFVLIALAAAFVVQLQAAWARIAVRVAGSWIFASGLLFLGWAARSK